MKENLNSLSKKDLIKKIKNLEEKLVIEKNSSRKIHSKNKSSESLKENTTSTLFNQIFNSTTNALYILDKNGKFIDINKAAEKMYGYSKKEIIGKTPSIFSAPKKNNMVLVRDYIKKAFEGYPQQFEFWGKRKNGEIFPKIVNLFKTGYLGNEVVFATGIDITKRIDAESKLKEKEQYIQSIFSAASVGIGVIDKDKISESNQKLCKILGFKKNELNGKPLKILFASNADFLKTKKIINEVIKKNHVDNIETKLITKTGKTIFANLSFSLIKKNKNDNRIIITVLDITKSKIDEEINAANKEKYKNLSNLLVSIADNIPDMIWAKDKDGKYTFVNKSMSTNLFQEKNIQNIIGKNDIYFYEQAKQKHPEDPNWHTFHQACLETDSIISKEKKSKKFFEKGTVRGKYLILDVNKSPLVDEKGNLLGIVGSGRNVTEEKKLENELKESQQKYSSLVEQANEAIIITQDFKVKFANNHFYKALGYTKEETLGQPFIKFLTKPEAQKVAEIYRNRLIGKKEVNIYESVAVAKDGTEIPIEINGNITTFDGKPATQSIIRNISERKKAEKNLRESEEKFANLFYKHSNPQMIFDVSDPNNFRITAINNALIEGLKNLGMDIAESFFKEKSMKEIYSLLPLDDFNFIERTFSNFYKVLKSKEPMYYVDEVVIINKKFYLLVSVIPILTINKECQSILFSIINETEKIVFDKALKDSEKNLRTILNASTDIIALVNNEGYLLEGNEKLQKALGISKDELIGCEIFKYFDKDVKDTRYNVFNQVLHTKSNVLYQDRANKRIWENSVNPILDENGEVIRLAVFAKDVTERELYHTKLKETNERLRNLSQHINEVREDERKNIAREIHDNLSQMLTAINMDVTWIKNMIPNEMEDIKERFEPLQKLIDSSIITVQKISTELRPGIIDDLGLVNAIEWQASEISKKTNLKFNLNLPLDEIGLPENTKITLFRVYQEALTNIIRHAKASNINISLNLKKKKLILEIDDDGIGIDDVKLQDKSSFGLISMRERIYAIDGQIDFDRNNNTGTKIKIKIPLKQK